MKIMSEQETPTSTVPEPETDVPHTQYQTAATHTFFAGLTENDPITFSLVTNILEPEPSPPNSEPIAAEPSPPDSEQQGQVLPIDF